MGALGADAGTAVKADRVLVLLLGFIAVTWYGTRMLARGATPWPALVAAGALTANGVTHVGQAVYFRGYVPGVVTALAIALPYGILLGRAFVGERRLSWRGWLGLIGAGFVVQVPLALAALSVGRA